jgi:putative tricarboxylic transport membrane protein
MLDAAFVGLLQVLQPLNLALLFCGVFMGIVFGALPGLTATMGLALLVPFTFTMSPAAGLIMLAGIYVGAMYGDAIPAILINTPGTPAAIATTFDGFALSQKGMAQHGLVAAAVASSFGSLVANVVLALAAPPLAEVSLKFGPPEYFWLGIFGLTIISTLSSGSVVKGFLAGTVGMILSAVGMAELGGDIRLTFGFPELQGGVELIVALIGFFCLPEILSSVIGKRRAAYTKEPVRPKLSVISQTIMKLVKSPTLMFRSAAIGTVVGFAPGAGGNIASMVSYNEACRWDKNSDEFGKGTVKGVAASEAANSAMAPGSLIPLLTLGIPGSPPAAVILGALMLHGMRPGAELFSTYADVTFAFIMALLVAAFLVTLIGSFGSFVFSRIINIPSRFLAPGIIFMTVLGSYAIRNNMLDVWIMFFFGLVGYISNKLKFHPAPIVLGLILGPFVEEGLVQSVLAGQAEGGMFSYMVYRPISGILIALSLMSLLWPLYASLKAKRKKAADCIPPEVMAAAKEEGEK